MAERGDYCDVTDAERERETLNICCRGKMWQDLKHLRDVCIFLLYYSALPIHKYTVSEQTLYSKEMVKFNTTVISVNVIICFFFSWINKLDQVVPLTGSQLVLSSHMTLSVSDSPTQRKTYNTKEMWHWNEPEPEARYIHIYNRERDCKPRLW